MVLHRERFPPDRSRCQDEWGWRFPEALAAGECAKRLCLSHEQYAATLARLRPGRGPCQALRDLLGRCRREGIAVALVAMPEASAFRNWYSRRGRAESRRLLAELHRTYGVEVIDANRWLPDGDFADGHHLLAAGADRFTRRLIGEIQRFLATAPPR